MTEEEKLAIKAIDELYANNGEDLKNFPKLKKLKNIGKRYK